MSSITKRLCARGKQCSQFSFLGQPQPLRSTSKSDVCEACQRAESDAEAARDERVARHKKRAPDERAMAGSVFEELREQGKEVLTSSDSEEVGRFVALKHDLVAQLVLERGPFWEQIRGMRSRWDVEPVVGIPPSSTQYSIFRPKGSDARRWGAELVAVKRLTIPELYYRWLPLWWERFISICVSFDPPYDALLEYAAHFGVPLSAIRFKDGPRGKTTEGALMVTPAIKPGLGADGAKGYEAGLLERAISLVAKRLKTQGIDLNAMLDDALNSPEVREQLVETAAREAVRHYSTDPEGAVYHYIDPDGIRNQGQLTRTQRMIQSKSSKGGRPTKGLLVAVECWYLHILDDWTYEDLAERYGWSSIDTAEQQVLKGLRAVAEGE
jgi:hypothetical protein